MPHFGSGARADIPERTRRLAAEALTCLRFYTRLPVPPLRLEDALQSEPFGQVLRWAPLAGAAVGLCGAGALLLAAGLGLPALVGATLAILATVLVGGGLHEDGLADVADGFGGGSTVARKLEIMRDSRLGSYGSLAIGFALLLRIGALTGLTDRVGAAAAALGLVAAASASRGFGLIPLGLLAPARPDGLGRAAGRLGTATLLVAGSLSLAIGAPLGVLAGFGAARTILALGLAALAATATAALARRQIGGQTGDVAGAAQQACEIALLLGLLAAPHLG